MAPTLSVVVIVYNDAARLPRAVRSVQRQGLADLEIVIVDDASTDGTQHVAEALAASDPARVRYHRLTDNSGGCSAPRNAGIERAAGRYVMFLDSDDELPPGACAALVDAVDSSGADFAAGLCMRRHLNRGGLLTAWYSWLFTERRVLASILDNPDLLYDTLSTNKCYRREFLLAHDLRFPVGFHYEDLLFSAQVYLHASRIALIPDLVYYWDVVDSTETPSISNRRHELSNFRDRILIHTKIDEAFAARGADELKLHKDVKFLRHDLRLYIAELPFRDPAFRRSFLDLARGYLATLDRRAYSRAEPVQAIVGYLIERDDEDNLFTAIDWIAHGRKLSTRLHREDDRIYWCAAHLDTDEGRAVLDVTDLGLHELPPGKLDLHNRITDLRVDGSVLHVSGVILNQLDRISPDAELRLELVCSPRRGHRSHEVRVDDVRRVDNGDIAWTAAVDLRAAVRAVGVIDRVWDLRTHLYVDGVRTVGRLSVRDSRCDGLALPVRPLIGGMAADHLETLVTPDGDLALQFVPTGRVARSLHERARRLGESATTRRARDVVRRIRKAVRDPRHPRLREELYRRTLLHLPAADGLVFFESEGGSAASGNPRAVHDELRRRGVGFDAVWAAGAGRRGADANGFPADATLVRHGSLAYYRTLARARVWVDDRGVPREAAKRPGTTYVQTFAGTPLKWVGFDAAAMRRATNADRLALRRRVDKWDALVVRSEFEAQTVSQAFRSSAELLRVGYPRCDALVNATAEDRAKARAEVGVTGDDDRVVLYLGACAKSLVPEQSMLAPNQHLLTGKSGPDRTTLLLAADVLVTQHHPAMFEFPLLRRPLVLLGCRCTARPRRGSRAETYFDLDQQAPAPVVWTADELRAELADLDALYAARREDLDRWVGTYATYDDGRAAAAVADYVERALGGSPLGQARG